MEKQWLLFIASVTTTTIFAVGCAATESPKYDVVHTEPDFEIRRYRDSVWMSAPVNDLTSFHQATKFGFHRLFQYIEGANLNWSRIPMTKPVVTSILPESVPLNSLSYSVHFYLPSEYQDSPPLPLHELRLKLVPSPGHCVAVRQFSGFARDGNVVKEADKLAQSLSGSSWVNSSTSTSYYDGKYAYSIAQYSSPFRITGRLNEVWVDVDGSGCGSDGIATY